MAQGSSAPPGWGPADSPPARGLRWIVPVRALVVLLAMVAAALGVLWFSSLGGRGSSSPLPGQTAIAVPPMGGTADGLTGPPPSYPGASGDARQEVLVHVAGAVERPGIIRLPAGSRVYQAIDAAGGVRADAEVSAVNLAAELHDGTQILVPTTSQAAAGMIPQSPGQASAHDPGQAAAGRVNINSADAQQLDTLPGIGPVIAARIVAWRQEHGPFGSLSALQAVPGIGAKLLAGLKDVAVVQ